MWYLIGDEGSACPTSGSNFEPGSYCTSFFVTKKRKDKRQCKLQVLRKNPCRISKRLAAKRLPKHALMPRYPYTITIFAGGHDVDLTFV